ncbi:MAG: hypothetical protein IKF19_00615 [Bacilli bacterium]|nr:hypothetical protein [Bacilli bacterium]
MKYSFLGVGMIIFGLFTLVAIVMFESITMDNDTEYYTLKEAMKASMYESLDKQYWARYGSEIKCGDKEIGGIKIVEQKFVENFTRRFKASVGGDADDYKIEFYDIIESPPKATIKITGMTNKYNGLLQMDDKDSINIVNNLTGILETNNCS